MKTTKRNKRTKLINDNTFKKQLNKLKSTNRDSLLAKKSTGEVRTTESTMKDKSKWDKNKNRGHKNIKSW